MTKDDLVFKDTALKMAIEALESITLLCDDKRWYLIGNARKACKEALEQEERTQRTMYCGTADAFIAMDDDHKRRWFVQSLRESKRRKELEDILEQPAQEPIHNCPNCNSLFTTEIHSIPAPSWQGLSDDEIDDISICEQISPDRLWHIYVAIEQTLKEKNKCL